MTWVLKEGTDNYPTLTLVEATENGMLNEIFENNLNLVSIDGRPFFITRNTDMV